MIIERKNAIIIKWHSLIAKITLKKIVIVSVGFGID